MPDAAGPAVPARGSIIGFDFGLARIGVAVGELETGQATALTTIAETSGQHRFSTIEQLLAEWQPVLLVVGIPYHLDGSEHELTSRCRRFANQLRGRFGLPVLEVDERLSSAEAETELKSGGLRDWRKRRNHLDAAAAGIIVQQFLDTLEHAPS